MNWKISNKNILNFQNVKESRLQFVLKDPFKISQWKYLNDKKTPFNRLIRQVTEHICSSRISNILEVIDAVYFMKIVCKFCAALYRILKSTYGRFMWHIERMTFVGYFKCKGHALGADKRFQSSTWGRWISKWYVTQ